jgi:hypothetical protein
VVDVLADPALPGSGVPVIARWTLPQLKDAIRAAILELDAASAANRSERARRGRHVRVREGVDGTAELVADLPAEAAAAVFTSLTNAAKAAKAGGDPRTLDQLRADELVHRATRGVNPAEYQPADHQPAEYQPADPTSCARPDSEADSGADSAADSAADSGAGPSSDSGAESGGDTEADNDTDSWTPSAPSAAAAPAADTGPDSGPGADSGAGSGTDSSADPRTGRNAGPGIGSGVCDQGRDLPDGVARCACGRAAPTAFVPSFTATHAGTPTRSTLVSLTMPLSTYLGLADQPGRLDGYGPVAAGLARRIAADAAGQQPAWTAWRCIVTDDVHGTVLGVTGPVWTPRHDPPPRLARLAEAMAPVCAFPGCRRPARCCDLDHRIPYQPTDPAGQRGGGRTCSCNLQPLCRNHHRQKTTGALNVRAITADEDPTAPAGTLEWTLPSGVTCRSHPHLADPGPIPTTGPGAHPDVAAAATHLAQRQAREQARRAAHPDTRDLAEELPDTDWAGDTWRQSRLEAAQARAEQAQRDAERDAEANQPPPF